MSDTMGQALTPDERLELETLRALRRDPNADIVNAELIGGARDAPTQLESLRLAQHNAEVLAAGGTPTEIPAKTALPDASYDFKVGQVVAIARPDGSTGHGLVVRRAPMRVTTPLGETLPGYVIAAFGPSNDMPATAESLGISALTPDETIAPERA